MGSGRVDIRLAGLIALALCVSVGPAAADEAAERRELRASLAEQRDALQRMLGRQEALAQQLESLRHAGAPADAVEDVRRALEAQREELSRLVARQGELEQREANGGAAPPQQARADPPAPPAPAPASPSAPAASQPVAYAGGAESRPKTVGEQPETSKRPVPRALESTLADVGGVLTPKGTLVVEPGFEYVQTATNRFSAEGLLIVESILLGRVQALQFDADAYVGSLTGRYGLTSRLEFEARVPYVYREEEVGTTLVGDQVPRFQSLDLDNYGIGDVEFGARYQLNKPSRGSPYFVTGVRVKTDTGKGPFDVDRDETGRERDLPTGSGFWSVEPNLAFVLPSDPAVLFGSVGYLVNLESDVDTEILPDSDPTDGEFDGAHFERVDPGDAVRFGLGFGLAVNQRLSVNVGASYDRVFATKAEVQGTTFDSDDLTIASFNVGGAYRWSDQLATNVNFYFGATDDTSDFRVVIRSPIWVKLLPDR